MIAAILLGVFFWIKHNIASKASVSVLTEPISLEEARKKLDIPLPDRASNILYAGYAEWVAYDFILKFEAPVDICKSHALLLLEEHNKQTSQEKLPLEFRTITETPTISGKLPFDIDWFDIHNIKNGLLAGDSGSHQPMIWIDTDRNIFYYRYTD